MASVDLVWRPAFVGTAYGSVHEVRDRLADALVRLGADVAAAPGAIDGSSILAALPGGSQLSVACIVRASPLDADPLRAGLDRIEVVAAVPANADVAALRALEAPLERFTSAELDRVSTLNPLVAAVCARYRDLRVDLRDVHLVFRDHLLLEKLNLVRELVGLRMPAGQCWILGKEDRSLFARQVLREYELLGARVLGVCDSADVGRAAAHVARELRGHRVLALDDGGELIANLLDRACEHELDVVPVETTSKGAAHLRRLGIERFVDLATSSIKAALSREIAVSCVVRARELLRHERLAGETCHVIGFGKLGRHVAALLREMGVDVTISEPDEAARAAAAAAGFPAFADAGAALCERTHRYVFGCSGVPALAPRHLDVMANPALLVSASSQDLRAVIADLDATAERRSRPGFGDTYRTAAGQVVHVLAHGHAVNLYQAEGVSEPEYDRFTALLAVTVVELARRDRSAGSVDVEALCRQVPARP